jgi:secreted trypsin-like serine protease
VRMSRLLRMSAGAAAVTTIAGLAALPGPRADAQIVGGTNAPAGAHPFMVSLQDMTDPEKDTPRERHICGGSLIRSNVVLSAAHCVFDTTRTGALSRPEDLDLIVGRTAFDTNQGEVRNAAAIVVHPEYDGNTHHGADVALIRLDVASTFATVRLPTSQERSRWAAGATNRLIGWGRNANGVVPNDLQQVDLTVQSDATMTSRYGADYIPTEMIGAGVGNGFGQCNGDSGGPLFFQAAVLNPGVSSASGSQFVQVATVSFSDKPNGCASAPGVLARVGEGPLRAWVDTMLSTPSITISDSTTPEGYRSNDPSICDGKTFCSFPGQAFFQVRLSSPTI